MLVHSLYETMYVISRNSSKRCFWTLKVHKGIMLHQLYKSSFKHCHNVKSLMVFRKFIAWVFSFSVFVSGFLLWKQGLAGRWLSVCLSVWIRRGIMGDGRLSTFLTNSLSVASARTCPSQWVTTAMHEGKSYKPLHLSLYNAPDP